MVHGIANFTLLGRRLYMPDLLSAVHGATGLTGLEAGSDTSVERPGLMASVLLEIAIEYPVLELDSSDVAVSRVVTAAAGSCLATVTDVVGSRVVTAPLVSVGPRVVLAPLRVQPGGSATTGTPCSSSGLSGTPGTGLSHPPGAPPAGRSSPAPVVLELVLSFHLTPGAANA